jgi:glycosyltransferase involved in cell wall biosynthesis
MKNKVCYIISNLDIGGAELSLSKIVQGLNKDFDFTIISFKKIGNVGEALKKNGINIISLELRNVFDIFFKLILLYKIIKKLKPDFVHTWMYHADFFGGIVSRLAGVKIVYWNIRNTELIKGTAFSTRIIGYINSLFSYIIPTKIILVSESSKKYHSKLLYSKNKMLVIPNGYDINKYKLDKAKRKNIRRELIISDESLIVGSIARFNEYKDHTSFINAGLKLLENNDKVYFVLIGRDVTLKNKKLSQLIENSKFRNNFYFLGEKNNIIDYYSAFDIFCLHSVSEGFPNVLAEAMAFGLPCVSTDVGDSKILVSNTQLLVPPMDHIKLSHALKRICMMSENERKIIGQYNQKIISSNYSTDILFGSYAKLYWKV